MQSLKTVLCLAIFTSAVAQGLASRQLLQAPAPAPGSCTTVAQAAQDANLTTLLAAATSSGLAATLSSTGLKYTVFAPTNEAFEEAISSLNVTADQLLSSPDLGSILRNHLLAYPLKAFDLISAKTVTTEYNNATLTIASDTVGGESLTTISTPLVTANVISADIPACQSIIHVIDEVLIPEIGRSSA